MIHFQMRFAWDRHLLCTKQSCNTDFFGFGGVRGVTLAASMAGAKGRSGGRRAGAGRKPGATQIKMPESKGIKKASKSGQSPPDANIKKLTAFFSTTHAGSSCSASSKKCTRAALDPCAPSLVPLALLPFGLGLC